jgi:Uma2 family endonuclease
MLRDAPVKTAMTFAEFLEFEERAGERHEFVDGNLFVMAGGTDRHNLIALLLISMVLQHALKCGYYTFNDVLLETPSGRGYYPDVYFVQQNAQKQPRVQYHPTMIVEVLSESTEAVDRGEKWQAYQQIESLEQYVLLSQTAPVAEVFSRDGETWRYQKLEGDAALRLECIQFEVTLSGLYENLPPLEVG